jgi:hypothetical protein
MTIVDRDGRLFGRWNFVDAVVVVLLVGLIPIGYAAYALFRTPTPLITSIEPTELVQGPNQRVTIRGVNLRPYLRVSFDTIQGATFLFHDSTKAVIDLNEMGPGTYDVVLYDYGQERARLEKAFTIKPLTSVLPTSEIMAAGRFINLTAAEAATITIGRRFEPVGEVVAIAPARRSVPRVFVAGGPVEVPADPQQLEVPAEMKLPCMVKVSFGSPECGGVDYQLRPNFVLTITLPSGKAGSFQVDQIRSTEPVRTIAIRGRFFGEPAALEAMTPGDIDVDLARNPFALGSRVVSLGPANPKTRSGVLEMKVQRMPAGWWYGSDTVRLAGQIIFKTDRYVVGAVVESIDANRPN